MEEADGENVGVLKFSREGGARLARHLDTLVHIGMTNAWAPMAFAATGEVLGEYVDIVNRARNDRDEVVRILS